MFLKEGYSVLVPDSRAHGASDGTFVTYGLLERYDVIAWAHKMHSLACHKLYGLGESLGASILIQASGVEPAFAAIVAESPYADLREIAGYRVQWMTHLPAVLARSVVSSAVLYARHVDGLDLAAVSPVRDIKRASTPILLIHGLAGRIPPSRARLVCGSLTGGYFGAENMWQKVISCIRPVAQNRRDIFRTSRRRRDLRTQRQRERSTRH
jgi:uncharacterized protein